MNWFEYAILNGQMAVKKANTLTDDWVDLELEKATNGYKHQGLEEGVYAVKIKGGTYAEQFFIVATGYSASHSLGNATYFQVTLSQTDIKYWVGTNTNTSITSVKVKKII